MLELLIKPSRKLPYYPNSGPGTKYLVAGDEEFGFFGEVRETEIKVAPQVIAANTSYFINYYSPKPEDMWLKFFYKRKVLFLPMFMFGSITWDSLWNSQIGYSVLSKGTGDYPKGPFNGVPIYTRPKLAKSGNDQLLIRALNAKPDSDDFVHNEVLATGEYRDLICNTFAPNLTSPIGVKYPASVLTRVMSGNYLTAQIAAQESASGRIHGGVITFDMANAMMGRAQQQAISQGCTWFPVLELMNAEDIGRLGLPVEFTDVSSDTDVSQPGFLSFLTPVRKVPRNLHANLRLTPQVAHPEGKVTEVPRWLTQHGEAVASHEKSEVSIIPPIIFQPNVISSRTDSSRVSVVNNGNPAFVVTPKGVINTNMAISAAEITMVGKTMYAFSGIAGTERQYGFQPVDQYPGYITQANLDTKAVTTSGTSNGTWNRGADTATHFYRFGGDTGEPMTFIQKFSKANLSRTTIAYPAGVTGFQVNFGKLSDGTMMQCGGYRWRSNESYVNGALFNPVNDTFTRIADMPSSSRLGTLIDKGTKVFVFPGVSTTQAGAVEDRREILIYDKTANTWSTRKGYNQITMGQNGVLYNGKFICIGRSSFTTSGVLTGFVFDLATETLKYFTVPAGGTYIGGFFLNPDGNIYLMCGHRGEVGGPDAKVSSNRVLVFDPEDFMQ